MMADPDLGDVNGFTRVYMNAVLFFTCRSSVTTMAAFMRSPWIKDVLVMTSQREQKSKPKRPIAHVLQIKEGAMVTHSYLC